jgi:hypothetical protein
MEKKPREKEKGRGVLQWQERKRPGACTAGPGASHIRMIV